MNGLRIVTWGLSAALHASLPLMLLFAPDNGSASLDAGSGNDQFTIERGIAIEGLSFTGDAMETVQAVDVPLVEQAVATPPVPQVEPVEQQAITTTDQAQAATVEARELEPPKEHMPEPPKREVVEAPPPVPQQVAVATQQASAQERTGGSATLLAKYQGELFKKIERHKINPRSSATGTVVVHLVIAPSGDVVKLEIASSSGSSQLDKAAMASLDRAAPYPPMPDGLSLKPMAFNVPFTFKVR